MKKVLLLLASALLFSCGGDDNDDDNNDNNDDILVTDYKQEMRDFVIGIANWSRTFNANMIIIPQNGQEIVTLDGEADGAPAMDYLTAINGVGREDLFYGYDDDDQATPSEDNAYMMDYLNICEENGVQALVTDYCWTESKMDDSYAKNEQHGFISFAAPDRELNLIPDYPETIYNENDKNISSLDSAMNFLYILNTENFSSKQEFIDAIKATNYDVIIMDLFFEDEPLTSDDIAEMHYKQNGGYRLLISYMSIGEAEDYRYYWKDEWNTTKPDWIAGENPDWEGNFKVKYWETEWQDIIFGNQDSYINKIIDAGFDGVYLDIIDAFEYFE